MTAYFRPSTLEDALAIRARANVMPLAGGTDVYPAKASRAGWGDMRHKDVLDLTGLDDLATIAECEEGWRIGALATWSQIQEMRLPPEFDGLKRAAREVGGVQIQNRGTLVGNLCTASPAGDGAPNLLALEAHVEIASREAVRRVPMRSFITGYRQTECAPHELVTAVVVPRLPAASAATFLKLGARRYLVISIAMVAGIVACDAEGRIVDLRLAVGACSATPQRLDALERALLGEPLLSASARVTDAHVADLSPIDDVRGSAVYRRKAALHLVRDALDDLARAGTRRAA